MYAERFGVFISGVQVAHERITRCCLLAAEVGFVDEGGQRVAASRVENPCHRLAASALHRRRRELEFRIAVNLHVVVPLVARHIARIFGVVALKVAAFCMACAVGVVVGEVGLHAERIVGVDGVARIFLAVITLYVIAELAVVDAFQLKILKVKRPHRAQHIPAADALSRRRHGISLAVEHHVVCYVVKVLVVRDVEFPFRLACLAVFAHFPQVDAHLACRFRGGEGVEQVASLVVVCLRSQLVVSQIEIGEREVVDGVHRMPALRNMLSPSLRHGSSRPS